MTEEKLWEFVAAWERKDVPTLMESIADDCVYITTTGPAPGTVYEGKEP
ncbi:MAG: nuclear transport factor 2 family protein [Chloroflexia bacterium]